MIPLLLAKLGTINWLTIAKIGAIISIMGATSYITWTIAQHDIDKERLMVAEAQFQAERLMTKNYLTDIEHAREIAYGAAIADRKLEARVNVILKEHSNAPSLPTNCVIDTNGVQSLSDAREAAIAAANNPATSKSDN